VDAKATRVIKRLISRKGEIQKDRNAVRLYSMRLSDANRSLIANVSFPIHRSHDRSCTCEATYAFADILPTFNTTERANKNAHFAESL